MIERYQLRYFLAVVETGTFSRAAMQVNVTQPTLSTGIAKLEAMVGGAVFIRNSKRVHLTPLGAQILEHARELERGFNILERVEKPWSALAPLRLGVLSTIPTRTIEILVSRALQAAPAEALEIIEGSESDLLNRLERRRIDVALNLVRTGEQRLHAEPLRREGYALALWDAHPLAGQTLIQPQALAAEVMIVRRNCEVLRETSRYFTECGVRPRFSFRTYSEDRAAAMVRAGLGVTVVPASWREPGVRLVPLAGFDFERQLGLLYAPSSPWAGMDRTVLTLAREILSDPAGDLQKDAGVFAT